VVKTSDPLSKPRPALAVDVALLTVADRDLQVVTVTRGRAPYRGHLALPGVIVRLDESPEDAARRALADETGLSNVFLEQLYTFGAVDRDPRARVVTVAYYALVAADRLATAIVRAPGVSLATIEVPWPGETGGPVEVRLGGAVRELAFDHADVIGMAVKRLRGKLDYTPIGFQLLPERFTLSELQRVHETVLGRPLNKDSFRRRMLASGKLEATGESQRGVDHRPAELYRFSARSAL
jgi:8-oxo-dGTP diphosphatase